MKKEFSFYEFTGILVPSVTLLYFLEILLTRSVGIHLIDFSKVGESVVFLTVAYGFGHILQSLGNLFEGPFWKIFGGIPSRWLTKHPRLVEPLFDAPYQEKVLQKIHARFGIHVDKDYGREVYNWLSLKDKITEKRIDVFNANYGMFRGLTISFYILSILTFCLDSLWYGLIPMGLGILANYRMFRFGRLYAQELFRTFLNYDP